MRNISSLRLQLMLGGAMLAVATAPAMAKDTPAASTDVQPATQGIDGQATAQDPNEGLGDIIVTATKRETSLQKTPIAISVIDPTTIKDRHIQSLLDFADGAVPSLRVTTFEARQSALTVGIRGIVPFDQNQTARESGVGVYIDGVYLGRSQGLNAALFDVERIEVLRGPQGTLFGRNTEGGALSIVTKQPTGEFGGRVTGGFGNFGQYSTEAHIDLPALHNFAVKLDGVIQHQDPTVKNPLAGQAGWNQYNRVGGRVSAKWTPTDQLTVTASYDKSKDENTPNYSQLLNYNPKGLKVGTYVGSTLTNGSIAPLSPLVVVSGGKRMYTADIGVPQQPSVDHTQGGSLNIKYKLTPDIEFRSITAGRSVDTFQWDNSGGAHRTVFQPNANFSRYSLSRMWQSQFSQEFQLVGSMPHLDWVAGLYYFHEKAREEAATPSSNKWNADGTGYTINNADVFGPITSSNQGWNNEDWFVQRGSRAKADSYAAFGQFTYTPAGIDFVHLTAGGRVTKDKRSGLLYTVQGKASDFTFSFDKTRFDPMVTLAVDATRNINLYAKYSTGYRAGGANDRSQDFSPFNPETVKSYEIGAKTDFLDHRVRLNVAGYIMDRKGTQTDFDNVDTNPNSPTFNLHTEEARNAPGTSKIRGIEADLTVQPVTGVTLGASYAYTYVNVPATPNPFLADRLFQVYTVYTPANAASGYIDYAVPIPGLGNGIGFRLHLDANYASSQYSFQNEAIKTDASFVVNGRIAVVDIPLTEAGTKATISVWTRNLFDTTYVYRRSGANASTLGDYGNFNPPRTFGVEGTINF